MPVQITKYLKIEIKKAFTVTSLTKYCSFVAPGKFCFADLTATIASLTEFCLYCLFHRRFCKVFQKPQVKYVTYHVPRLGDAYAFG